MRFDFRRLNAGDPMPGAGFFNRVLDALKAQRPYASAGGGLVAVETPEGVALSLAGGGGAGSGSEPHIARTGPAGVGPRIGTTMGAASCRIWRLRLVSGALTLVDSGRDITLYNLAQAAVAGSVYVQYKHSDGFPVIDWEECQT